MSTKPAVNLPPLPSGAAWIGPDVAPTPGEYELLLKNGTASRGTCSNGYMCIWNYVGHRNLRVPCAWLKTYVQGYRK